MSSPPNEPFSADLDSAHRLSASRPFPHAADGAPGKLRDDDAKQRLIDAAGPVFAQSGYDRATVREICRHAGVNVAAVGYYFGDKFGLYREVIFAVRNRCQSSSFHPFPIGLTPHEELHFLVTALLTQMLSGDHTGWESQLMMREMNRPTAVFAEMVDEFFRPMFNRITTIIRSLAPSPTPIDVIEKLALSVIGQCLYYRVGAEVVRLLIPDDRRNESFDIQSLARHISGVTIAASENSLGTRCGETLASIPFHDAKKPSP